MAITATTTTTTYATGAKKANNAPKKQIWSSLLDSVSTGKKVAEKQLIVLGTYSTKEEGKVTC